MHHPATAHVHELISKYSSVQQLRHYRRIAFRGFIIEFSGVYKFARVPFSLDCNRRRQQKKHHQSARRRCDTRDSLHIETCPTVKTDYPPGALLLCDEKRRSVPWLHAPGGTRVQVYVAGGSSTPAPKLSRLAALLERSPDTLAQLSRQDRVSRRQELEQRAAAAAEDEKRDEKTSQDRQQGRAGGKDEASVGAGGAGAGGRLPTGPGAPVLVFVAGDRSQVRLLVVVC